MKTVFVYNPKAGKGGDSSELSRLIDRLGCDAEIYTTKSVGDARRYVKDYCTLKGPARFIACGGDGTLNEVLNGVIGFDGAEVGVLPTGTGNDFVRNFVCPDAGEITYSPSVMCDAIRCTLTHGARTYVTHCANMVNIGFDCNAVHMTANMKKKPFVSGTLAYVLSVLVMLIRKKGAAVRIEADGTIVHEGELLLTSVANGSFCGGGFMSNPLASVCDGLININIIKNVSRLRFISLLPSYKKGTFLNKKGIEKIAASLKCKRIKITSLCADIKVCIDGEIFDACEAEFDIIPSAFSFVGKRK